MHKKKAPENMTVYKPDEPVYEVLHLCVYLSELPEIDPNYAADPGHTNSDSKIAPKRYPDDIHEVI